MKIIVAGAGEVGIHLAKMLSYEGHKLTLIEIQNSQLQSVNEHIDLVSISGSSLSINTLTAAQVQESDLFIAVTQSPDTNIASAIIAKKMGAKQTIARVHESEFLKTKNSQLFQELGIDSFIFPQHLAAQEISNFLKQASSREVFDFADGRLSLFVLKVDDHAPVVGKTLKEAALLNSSYDYRTVAITRNSQTIIPKSSDKFSANDLIYVVSNKRGIKKVYEYSGKKKVDFNNIMILGGGRTGAMTASLLENQFNVKLIEMDKQKATMLADQLFNTLVIHGDGRSTDLLVEEGIRKTDAFIALSGDSETNILSCLLAKRLGVKKTIAEIENIDYMYLAENMGIDTIINRKFIAASHIYKFTLHAEVSTVKHLSQTDAEMLEFVVHKKSRIANKIIKESGFPKEATIGGIVRGKEVLIARGDTQIEPGDKVLVFSLPSVIPIVQSFFEASM